VLSLRPARGRRLSRLILASAPVLALAIAQACAAPTQARVRIRSTLTCDQLNGVNIVVGPSSEVAEARVGERAVNTTARDCVADPSGSFVDLGTVVLAPGEERGAVVVVAGTKNLLGVPPRAADLCGVRSPSGQGDYKDCIVARRRFSYVDNKTLEFTITLDNACINQPCDAATETCSAGKCVTAELSCQSETCVVPNEGQDAAAPLDAAFPPDGVALPLGTDADVVDAAVDDALEPLAPCEPRCPTPDAGTGNTPNTCAPGNECCVSDFSSVPTGTCVPEGSLCKASSVKGYARLCCTKPCGPRQRCVAITPPMLGGGLALQTRCLRAQEPDPEHFAAVLCSTGADCPTGQDCRDITRQGFTFSACE